MGDIAMIIGCVAIFALGAWGGYSHKALLEERRRFRG